MHVLPAFAGSTYSFIVPKKQNSVKEIFGKYPPFALLAFWHFGIPLVEKIKLLKIEKQYVHI